MGVGCALCCRNHSGCGCNGGVPCAVGTIVGVAVVGVCPVL